MLDTTPCKEEMSGTGGVNIHRAWMVEQDLACVLQIEHHRVLIKINSGGLEIYYFPLAEDARLRSSGTCSGDTSYYSFWHAYIKK